MNDLARKDVTPFWKSVQLARQERRYKRKVAGAKRWQQIQEAKQGPCRCCRAPAPSELHHLVPRSQGGSDTEANLVPLCRGCHQLVEARDHQAGAVLARSLTDSEYAYAVDMYGEGFFERRLGVRYARAAGGGAS